MNDHYLTAEEVHNYDQAFAESETALGMIIAGYLERLEAGRKDGIPESAITVSMAIFLEKWEPGPLSSVLSVAIVALARKFQLDDVEHCDPTMDCPNCGPEVRPEPEPDDAA